MYAPYSYELDKAKIDSSHGQIHSNSWRAKHTSLNKYQNKQTKKSANIRIEQYSWSTYLT